MNLPRWCGNCDRSVLMLVQKPKSLLYGYCPSCRFVFVYKKWGWMRVKREPTWVHTRILEWQLNAFDKRGKTFGAEVL